jgi:DNA-binding beta-propeller fold protein YncE
VVIVEPARASIPSPKSYGLILVWSALALIVSLFAAGEKSAGTRSTGTESVPIAALLPGDMCTWSESPAASAGAGETPPMGGEIPPVRYVIDPYPTFNGVAIDVANDRVIMSDENRKSVLMYDRTAGNRSSTVTSPLRQIIGPQTEIGYISGVETDPARRELYAVNNDIEDRIVVFDYDAHGDLKPKRHLYVPHQTWGVSLNPSKDEIAISVQQLSMVGIYRREATALEAPLRIISGPHTGLADPHGIRWDVVHHEIAVASHGNYSVIAPYSAYDAGTSNTALSVGGHFLLPSVTVFEESAKGDAKPLRKIQGSQTRLNWPMGIDIDTAHNEMAVANNGDDAVLVFDRTVDGDAEPRRVIRGPRTGISSPMGVAIDAKNDELWVANYGDHTALVFSRTATGDVSPKRIIRNAPEGTPTGGFGNPYAVAYDSKRDQLLVPN